MQIKIDIKIFIFAIIFFITRQIKIYAFLMAFALIHELGHMIAGLLLGLKPQCIEIAPYGFNISFRTNYDDYNIKIKNASLISLKKIIIATAGPITNLIIAVCTYIYCFVTSQVIIFNINADMIIYANILIFIFNLIPIYPLDGGRILKEIIKINRGIGTSYIYINKISNISIIIITILSSFLILKYKNIAIIIVLVYLWLITIRENKRVSNILNYFSNI